MAPFQLNSHQTKDRSHSWSCLLSLSSLQRIRYTIIRIGILFVDLQVTESEGDSPESISSFIQENNSPKVTLVPETPLQVEIDRFGCACVCVCVYEHVRVCVWVGAYVCACVCMCT